MSADPSSGGGMPLAAALAFVDQSAARQRDLERWFDDLPTLHWFAADLDEHTFRRCRDQYAALLELDGATPLGVAAAALDLAGWVADDVEAEWWSHVSAHWLSIGVGA